MKKFKKFNWIIISLILVVMAAIILIMPQPTIPDNLPLKCDIDDDCVPAQCCHPNSCVNIKYQPDCSGIFCTEECRGGTMDCGCGHCECVNNRCEVAWTKTQEWC